MIKRHNMRFLAVLLVVCYLITSSPVAQIAQASGLLGDTAGDVSGGQTEGIPGNPEETLDDELGEELSGDTEEPDGETEGLDGETEEPDGPLGDDEGDGEPETGDEESPARTSLTVRHVLLMPNGDQQVLEDIEMDDLEVGTVIRGSDLAEDFGPLAFSFSDPEELALGEEDNLIELFYEPVSEFPDNPDGLEKPEKAPAPELYIPPRGLGLMGGPMGGLDSILVDEDGNIEEGYPGYLSLTKTAEQVPGSPNRWRVTLTLTGTNLPTTSDVVLVIDRSGSMGQGSGRMQAAKDAAESFVNGLLDGENPGTRIALVSFASSVTTHSEFQGESGKQTLIDAIRGLSASGGTWTQAGIKRARDLLAGSTAGQRVIVLLSDGEPTYSYQIRNINHLNEDYFFNAGFLSWHTRVRPERIRSLTTRRVPGDGSGY